MDDDKLLRMADILLPTAQSPTPSIVPILLMIAAIVVFSFVAWRRWHRPLDRLSRELRRNILPAREVAHRLAGLTTQDTTVRRQIDRLRFRRAPPAASDLLRLIEKLRHER